LPRRAAGLPAIGTSVANGPLSRYLEPQNISTGHPQNQKKATGSYDRTYNYDNDWNLTNRFTYTYSTQLRNSDSVYAVNSATGMAQPGEYYRVRQLDIAEHAQAERACAHLLDESGRLDVLVNAAGILRLGATEEVSLDDWRASFDVNVSGAFDLLRKTIAQFKLRRSGAVVTVGSDAAHVSRLSMAAYCASKVALASLTHCAALELAPYGVRCNLVSPGSTDTPMQRSMWSAPDTEQRVFGGFPEAFKLGVPLGKIAEPLSRSPKTSLSR
jgi:NAD(P)-dependent dehydrogenase (short-subunit alcohol dehydrogenase family)